MEFENSEFENLEFKKSESENWEFKYSEFEMSKFENLEFENSELKRERAFFRPGIWFENFFGTYLCRQPTLVLEVQP